MNRRVTAPKNTTARMVPISTQSPVVARPSHGFHLRQSSPCCTRVRHPDLWPALSGFAVMAEDDTPGGTSRDRGAYRHCPLSRSVILRS